jgi:hypothetical protein
MATVPHRVGEERTSVPRIVLPITSRGLVVTDRLCWGMLGAAMAVAAALILYLNRGTIFYLDEISWLYETPNLDSVGDVLERHNGHLIATTRLTYKAILETIGAEYVAFRLIAVSAVLLSAALYYALVKRRIGALPALAPTLVLLFPGSAWQHVVGPIGSRSSLRSPPGWRRCSRWSAAVYCGGRTDPRTCRSTRRGPPRRDKGAPPVGVLPWRV